jgi:hypothetical protein
MRAKLSEDISCMKYQANCEYIKTAGDDCLDSNEDCRDFYLRKGKVITDFAANEGTYSFCSTTFAPGGSYQQNIRKSFYSILTKKVFDSDQRRNFKSAFYNHPEYRELEGYLRQVFGNTW